MRILYATHYALPHLGGIEVAVSALSRALAERGHEVCVLASDAGAADGDAQDDGYRVVRVPALNHAESHMGVPYPVFSPRLLGALRREIARADVVHGHGFLYQSSVAALAAARAAPRSPARVLTEHVGHVRYDSRLLDGVERAAIATVGRLAARAAQAHVVFNTNVASLLRHLVPGRRTAWILNGVDTERFRPATDEQERGRLRASFDWDERPRVLFAGRPVAKKGFDIALAAVEQGGGGFRLAVAGPEARPPGLPGAVDFLGRLTPVRMAEAYRAADAVMLPSRGEGLPMVAQEALASGLPVVMTDDPGYRSTMAAGGPAVCLIAPEAAAMAAAVIALVTDREAHAVASRAAVAFARSAFSWQHSADEHERLYADLLEAR